MSYGCYNRKPFAPGEVLHGIDSRTGEPMSIYLSNRMQPDCQYQKDDPYGDPGCLGCLHNLKEKQQ